MANPFETAMAEAQDTSNPFAVAQLESQGATTNESGGGAADDPFADPDPFGAPSNNNNNNNKESGVAPATADLFTQSANNNNNNNNNNNTAPTGENEGPALATASTTSVPVVAVAPQQTQQQPQQQKYVPPNQQVQRQSQLRPGATPNPTITQALKLAQLRPGPCCTLHKSPDSKAIFIEFIIQVLSLSSAFIALSLDLLATHYTSNLDIECGAWGCYKEFEVLGISDEDYTTYLENCDDDDFSSKVQDEYCDLSSRGFFWVLFGVFTLSISTLILAIYLQRDCKFMVVEFNGFKCGRFHWRFKRRHCLYLTILNILIILSQVLLWSIDNWLFDESEQEVNYDLGLSVWLNVVSIGLSVIGLVHGYYQPEVFSTDPL